MGGKGEKKGEDEDGKERERKGGIKMRRERKGRHSNEYTERGRHNERMEDERGRSEGGREG